MIRANEVRLGNWLTQFPENVSIQVQDLIQTEFSYLLNGLDLELFRAIEITPELLEQFGFKKQYDCWYHGTFIIRDIFEELFYHPNGVNVGQQIEYLHQLQNLYFAVSGEELDVEW